MTNAPETRKTHVIRILGTNRNGDVLSDIWADVERIDVAKSASQDSQGFWQGVQRKLDWHDDPTRDDYNPDGNPARQLEIVKVCDPQTTADVNDPDEWIPVPIIRSMKSRRSDAGTQDRHRNNGPDDGTDAFNAARVVEARRIYRYDTSIDAAATAAFDADPTLKAYVVQGSDYVRDDSSKDDGQYVEHEIITFLKDSGNDERVSRQGQVKLLNDYLINESDPARLDVTGNAGINPPYRLDPYQNIINVQFKSLDQQWLLAVSNSDPGVSYAGHTDTISARGGGQSNTFMGASGSGITVYAGAVAYGSVKLSDGSTKRAFMACRLDMRTVNLGLVSPDGHSISWSAVFTIPSDPGNGYITGISYANDRFFVTWCDFSSGVSVRSTQDGENFSAAASPFPVEDGFVVGGGVAYNKKTKTYCMVGGTYNGDHETEFGLAVSYDFCWATSPDGIAWAGSKLDGVFKNPGGTGNNAGNFGLANPMTVAAGNGVFIGAAINRHEVTMPVTTIIDGTATTVDAPYVISSAAVAFSRDGATWTMIPLPGAFWQQNRIEGDVAGQTNSVAFIADKDFRDSNGSTGYFVACAYEGSAPGFENAKLWMSVDGQSWQMIRSETHDVGQSGNYVVLSAIDKTIKTIVRFT